MPEDPGHLKRRGESSVKAAPVSRSIIVPRKSAAVFRAGTDLSHVRMPRTLKCTVMGGLLQP